MLTNKLKLKKIIVKKNSKKFKILIEKKTVNFRLKKDDVVIKNYYSSINYRDYLASKGNLAVARRFPYCPGVDLVGTVEYSNNKNFSKGNKVGSFSIPNNIVEPGAWSNFTKIKGK